MSRGERGHRSLPHTADIRIEAWAPTREACLTEAVAGLVDGFADTAEVQPDRTVTTDVPADNDEDALVGILDEVIYLLDTEDVIPLNAEVEYRDTGIRVRMPVTSARTLDLHGAIPKAVALYGLGFSSDGRGWSCTATIDV